MSASLLPASDLSFAIAAQFSVSRVLITSRAALGLVAVLRGWRRRHPTASRVALPGAICHEVVLAVLAAGYEPLFCDVDTTDGLVKETEWAKARALGADVAIVVHLYGNVASVEQARKVFPVPDCLIVDDAAQALGSYGDGLAGSNGDVGLLSFGSTKHISLGNAAVLFHDIEFAEEVALILEGIAPEAEKVRGTLAIGFRSGFERARALLRSEGGGSAGAFAGLLEGLEGILHKPPSLGIEQSIVRALDAYPTVAETRVSKSKLWSKCLAGTDLEPVGMGRGCVPWRYVCRLPGLDWPTQHRLSESMRKTGMHVSNWYLPAHWLLGGSAGELPGVERLSREVFQFWVDDSVSHDSIARDASVVKAQLRELPRADLNEKITR